MGYAHIIQVSYLEFYLFFSFLYFLFQSPVCEHYRAFLFLTLSKFGLQLLKILLQLIFLYSLVFKHDSIALELDLIDEVFFGVLKDEIRVKTGNVLHFLLDELGGRGVVLLELLEFGFEFLGVDHAGSGRFGVLIISGVSGTH